MHFNFYWAMGHSGYVILEPQPSRYQSTLQSLFLFFQSCLFFRLARGRHLSMNFMCNIKFRYAIGINHDSMLSYGQVKTYSYCICLALRTDNRFHPDFWKQTSLTKDGTEINLNQLMSELKPRIDLPIWLLETFYGLLLFIILFSIVGNNCWKPFNGFESQKQL